MWGDHTQGDPRVMGQKKLIPKVCGEANALESFSKVTVRVVYQFLPEDLGSEVWLHLPDLRGACG